MVVDDDRSSLIPLTRSEAHLWWVLTEDIGDPNLLARYHELMSRDERSQRRRFYFEKDRRDYAIARAFVRITLSRYTGVDPNIWRFKRNAYGRPEISHPRGVAPLRFNLSHTNGLIACAVILEREIGIDVEDTEVRGAPLEVADQSFSPIEVAALQALPESIRGSRFFEFWTLKEAYIKARGLGVSIPLQQFSFHIEPGQPLRVSFDDRLKDDPFSWQFAQFRPTARHVMAIAIRRGRCSDLNIEAHQTIP